MIELDIVGFTELSKAMNADLLKLFKSMSNSKIKIRGVVGKETFAEITEDEFEQVAQAIDADKKLHNELKEYHTEWYAAEISDDPLAFADVPVCSRDVSRLTGAVCKDQNAEKISILLLIEYIKDRFGDVYV